MDDATYKRLVQYQRTRREDLGSRDYDNGRVLLDAFRAVFEEVPGAVLDSLAPRTIGLFEDYPDTRGAAKAPANIPWQCQFAQSNLAVTDAMARALAAVGGTEVSRSSVLLTALDLFLPPLAPKRFAGDRSRKRGGSSAKQAATD
ncbi:hypothetical protein OG216_46355 (plasmid) [Streptomycetaceae bacterium NBC_01309]